MYFRIYSANSSDIGFFLFLIVNVIPHESIIFVYLTFFSSILAVAGFDLAINNIHLGHLLFLARMLPDQNDLGKSSFLNLHCVLITIAMSQ